jgi:hypothetical protein
MKARKRAQIERDRVFALYMRAAARSLRPARASRTATGALVVCAVTIVVAFLLLASAR